MTNQIHKPEWGSCECGRPVLHPKSGECHGCYLRSNRAKRGLNVKGSNSAPTEAPCDYNTAHHRVRHWRGSAKLSLCVDCGLQAQEWSYNHGSELELSGFNNGTDVVHYSPRIWDYSPRCRPCHTTYDLTHGRGRGRRATPPVERFLALGEQRLRDAESMWSDE